MCEQGGVFARVISFYEGFNAWLHQTCGATLCEQSAGMCIWEQGLPLASDEIGAMLSSACVVSISPATW